MGYFGSGMPPLFFILTLAQHINILLNDCLIEQPGVRKLYSNELPRNSKPEIDHKKQGDVNRGHQNDKQRADELELQNYQENNS